jgi:hypothetical protein
LEEARTIRDRLQNELSRVKVSGQSNFDFGVLFIVTDAKLC